MRATDGVLVDLLASDGAQEFEVVLGEEVVVGRRLGKVDLADGRDEGDNLDAVRHLEVALGDGARSDAACVGQRGQSRVLARVAVELMNVPMVSLALLLPPPLLALMPYLRRYVQSA